MFRCDVGCSPDDCAGRLVTSVVTSYASAPEREAALNGECGVEYAAMKWLQPSTCLQRIAQTGETDTTHIS